MGFRNKILTRSFFVVQTYLILSLIGILKLYNTSYYQFLAYLFLIIWITIQIPVLFDQLKRKELTSPVIVFLITTNLFIFLPLFFDTKDMIYFPFYGFEYKNEYFLSKSIFIIILGFFSFYAGTLIARGIKINNNKRNRFFDFIDKKHNLIFINILLFLIVLIADFYVSYTAFGSIFGRLNTSYFNQGQMSSLRLVIYIYPMIIINNYYLIKKYSLNFIYKMLLVFITLYILFISYYSGVRALILVSIFGILLIYFRESNLKFKHILLLSVSSMILYFLFLYMQISRVSNDEVEVQNLSWNYDTVDVAMLVTSHFPEREYYSLGKSLYSLITNPLPRSLFPGKPYPFGKEIALIANPHLNDTPSSYAAIMPIEFYSNFGILGMMGMLIFFGLLINIFYKSFGKAKELNVRYLIYANFASSLFMVFRGDFTTKTVSLAIPLIIFLLLSGAFYVLTNILKLKKY